MVRVKRGKKARRHRKKILKQTKGFRWGRKTKYRLAKDALRHAWTYAYRDRKVKKREFRRLWQTQISAACRELGWSYSRFIHALKENKIELDRKILAELIQKQPTIFKQIFEMVKK